MCTASARTDSLAVKATTRTSAPGNKPRRAAAGFTLLELMVVVVIVGIASAAVTMTLRDRSQSKLEEEGARLSALLESARTQSRIVGTDVRWQPLTTGGFQFMGLPSLATKELPSRWLDSLRWLCRMPCRMTGSVLGGGWWLSAARQSRPAAPDCGWLVPATDLRRSGDLLSFESAYLS